MSSGQLAPRAASAGGREGGGVAKDSVSIDSTQWAEYMMVFYNDKSDKKKLFSSQRTPPCLLLSQMDPNHKKCGKYGLQGEERSAGCAALPGNIVSVSG